MNIGETYIGHTNALYGNGWDGGDETMTSRERTTIFACVGGCGRNRASVKKHARTCGGGPLAAPLQPSPRPDTEQCRSSKSGGGGCSCASRRRRTAPWKQRHRRLHWHTSRRSSSSSSSGWMRRVRWYSPLPCYSRRRKRATQLRRCGLKGHDTRRLSR
jgi:hypothetical protein